MVFIAASHMAPSRTIWPSLVAAALVAASASLIAAAGAPRPGIPPHDGRQAFRRPPQLVADGRAQADAVWQIGRRLFFDPGASASGTTSCATCHRADRAWSDAQARAVGDNGQLLPFKSPTLLNVAGLDRLGWTGRFADTPSVSLFAMNSTATMNMPVSNLIDYLGGRPDYVDDFKHAFGDGVTRDNVGTALARYVNSITSAPTSFDRWVEGDETAIDVPAKRGFAVFAGKGGCTQCHGGWTFTDGSFHDIGTSDAEPGRGTYFPTSLKLQHAFKTPSLRGVAERAPYMHDGSRADLDAVIALYDQGGIDRPSRAEPIKPLHLSPGEKADLKSFLLTLSGPTDFILQ